MSATTQVTAQQLRAADDSVGSWLLGLIDGKGDSPSHIVVTAVLGCVPVVGQLFDLRDLIRCILALTVPGAGAWAWAELVITLIGCIPGFGDAFKAGVKLARQGAKADRVFDTMREFARFDPEKALRQLDWGKVRAECLRLLNQMLDGIVDALDGWIVQLVVGRQQVKETIDQLKALKSKAPQMIDEAIADLRKTIDEMLGAPRVASTAEVSAGQRALPTGGSNRGGGKRNVDDTGKQSANRNTPNSAQVRQAKRRRWETGVPAQHITDYYSREKRGALRKINNHGRLVEEWERHRSVEGVNLRGSGINTPGIDHLWLGQHNGNRYTVGETKGSTWAQFSFLAGLSASDKEAVEATRTDTAATLNKGEYDPGVPMTGDRPTSQTTTISDESALSDEKRRSGTLKKTKTKGRQMSHKWVLMSIEEDNSIANAYRVALLEQIETAVIYRLPKPYNREVFMVTGKQYEEHDRAKGGAHKVQLPIINIPDGVLLK